MMTTITYRRVKGSPLNSAEIDQNFEILENQVNRNTPYWRLNEKTITENQTIPDNLNALTAGPITLLDGVDVVVPVGSNWTIV